MKLINTIILLFALTLLMPFAVEAFTVDVDSVHPRIQPGESALFNVTITNFEDRSRTFANSLGPADTTGWILSPNSVSIPPEESRSFLLSLRPRASVNTGTHRLAYRVRDSSGNTINANLAVSLISEGQIVGYIPNVQTTITVSPTQDPRDELVVEVEMINRNRRDLQGLNLTIAGEMFHEVMPLQIPPLETVNREFRFQINDMQEPGIYDVRAELFYNETNSIISTSNRPVEIVRYSNIEPVFESETSWFKTTQTITLFNDGNHERIKEVAIKAPFYQRIFLSSGDDYEVLKINGKTNVQWSPTVAPGEEVTIFVYRDYRPLVLLILIILIAIIGYYAYRSPLLIKKQVYFLNKDSEGVSEFKVRLYIKNRSGITVNGVKVKDYLSRLTEYEAIHDKSTIKPDKVAKTSKKGTILTWNLDNLESMEERILTYRLKSTLRIIGNLTLPKSKVVYLNNEGKEDSTTSFEPKFKQ